MQVDLLVSPAVAETTQNKRPKTAIENGENKESVKKETSSNLKNFDGEKLQELQRSLAEQNIALRFSKDADTKILVVEMVDDKTGEAILQLPSKVSLKLAAEAAKLQGLFVNRQI